MDAMRLSVNARTSRRVSLYWTSGSPSFSCSSSHDKAQKMNDRQLSRELHVLRDRCACAPSLMMRELIQS